MTYVKNTTVHKLKKQKKNTMFTKIKVVPNHGPLQKNFTKILGINGQKKACNRNYLHKPRTFLFLNIVHSVLLYETFRMIGHSISSNIVKFIKIRFE